jgi:hypothetical protein
MGLLGNIDRTPRPVVTRAAEEERNRTIGPICPFLPPRVFDKCPSIMRMVGRGGGDRNRIPISQVSQKKRRSAAALIQLEPFGAECRVSVVRDTTKEPQDSLLWWGWFDGPISRMSAQLAIPHPVERFRRSNKLKLIC